MIRKFTNILGVGIFSCILPATYKAMSAEAEKSGYNNPSFVRKSVGAITLSALSTAVILAFYKIVTALTNVLKMENFVSTCNVGIGLFLVMLPAARQEMIDQAKKRSDSNPSFLYKSIGAITLSAAATGIVIASYKAITSLRQ